MRASIRILALVAAALIGAFAIGIVATRVAIAGVIGKARAADSVSTAGTWLAWGGQTRFHFNPDELDRLARVLP